jgi:hypothetical protein
LGINSLGSDEIEGGKGGGDAQRSIELTTVGDRIEMTSDGNDPSWRRVAPVSPKISVAVDLEG